jgi:endonuclease/exonuclease/phosphatase (EEP) superfamily protein YafD
MEYFLGAVIAVACMAILSKIVRRESKSLRLNVVYRQSHIFSMLSSSLIMPLGGHTSPELLDTQATRYFDSKHLRVLFFNDRAYWIKDQQVYVADVLDGIVDEQSTKTLDMMAMSKVELDEMIFIIDKLNEGSSKHDGGNSGNQKL